MCLVEEVDPELNSGGYKFDEDEEYMFLIVMLEVMERT
jgi:hypothetical protein